MCLVFGVDGFSDVSTVANFDRSDPLLDAPFRYDKREVLKPTHLKLFESLMDKADNTVGDYKTLLVLCSPRSGSTLLADMLNHSGCVGMCEEWFNFEYMEAYRRLRGVKYITFREYFDFLKRKTISNGVFSIKAHLPQVIAVEKAFKLDLEYFNPDYTVYVYRRDKVAQAVSLAKAIASDQFRHDEEQLGDPKTVDHEKIAKSLAVLVDHDKAFHVSFYADLKVAYEDFSVDTGCCDTIIKALGKTPPSEYTTGLKKQADEHSKHLHDTFITFITGNYE